MEENKNRFSRRDLLKGFATLPVLGAMGYGAYRKWNSERLKHHSVAREIGFQFDEKPATAERTDGKTLRIGIIGTGLRGQQILRSAGFAHPEVLDRWKKAADGNKDDFRYSDYLAQGDLNIEIAAVCDIFEANAKTGLEAAANGQRATVVAGSPTVKRYRHYPELLADRDIDAVIIAAPDHWHAQMTIDAARAGKHVYVEKPLTRTFAEIDAVRQAVRESGIVLQLGHQNRQIEAYRKAKEIIDKNVLGKISLVEICTNRNSPVGAWVYPIHPDASPETIDWQQFVATTNPHEFSLERFFRWRCWWDYSTGLAGDLLTHDYDCINQILRMGIPQSVVSSGGVYFYKDGREVPDVWQTVLEYPDRGLSVLYSASLASNKQRGRLIMGQDASMDLGTTLTVTPDDQSERYRSYFESGVMKSGEPMLNFVPGQTKVDAVSSATEKYFASRGLMYTYSEGKRVDTTYLHLRDWLSCVRFGGQPACNIDEAFDEAVTAAMTTVSYREQRTVRWDADAQKLI